MGEADPHASECKTDIMVLDQGANGAPPPTAALGTQANTTSGANTNVAGYPNNPQPEAPNGSRASSVQTPSGVSPSAPAPSVEPPVTIIWASAVPVRLAVLKLRSGPNRPTETEMANATRIREGYTIAVVGLPPPDPSQDPQDLAKRAFLTVHGRAPVVATESNYRKIGNSDVYFFRFTKTSVTLTTSDQDVEFKMALGKIAVKRKFVLKDMQYQGQLAL